MTAKKRIQLGVWVSIVGLALATIGSIGGGAVGYGKLSETVRGTAEIAHEADSRSIENSINISAINGKLDLILKHVAK